MRLLFLACLLLFSSNLYSQDIKAITLKPENEKYMLQSYYISKVEDSTDRENIGNFTQNATLHSIQITNGITQGLQAYLDNSTTHGNGANALTLVINTLDVTVKTTRTGYATGLRLIFSIYAGNIKIESFKNEGRIVSSAFPQDDISTFITKSLKGQLQGFDKVWATHKDKIPMDTIAAVTVAVNTTTDLPDCIAYSQGMQLNFDDFQSADYDKETFAAGTSSGLRMEYSSNVEHGKMVVNVSIAALFYKAKSWFKPDAKVPVLLAHEQAHFDVTAIIACEMAARIKATTFTMSRYDKQLLQILDDFTKEKETEGIKYDTETDHGRIPERQLEWQERVRSRLKEVNCY